MSSGSSAKMRAPLQLSLPNSSSVLPSPSFSATPGTSTPINFLSEGLLTVENYSRQIISIDTLSDDVLLAIFDFCAGENPLIFVTRERIEAWQPLVHVCRRWRSVVFASPRRLNLRLFCTSGTPRDALDVWPALPLLISDRDCSTRGLDNIVALLEHSNRVCQISFLQVTNWRFFDTVLMAMQEPFPELTDLVLWSLRESMPVLPDSFLGGSTPRLRKLSLDGISFPGLPKLLLSAAHLVGLYLWNIPYFGYISPKAMVTVLSTLTNLGSLHLQFKSPQSRPNQATQHLPPPKRSSLPVFTELRFRGASEYFEDLVSRIDVPRLSTLYITFFNQIVFDTPQVVQFIRLTPRLKAFKKAHVVFDHEASRVNFSSRTYGHRELDVGILFRDLDWKLSSLVQIFTLSLPPLTTLGDLYIYEAHIRT